MIETFALRGGRVVKPKPGKFGKGLVWVRCVKPRLKDLNILSKISKIPVEEFEESMSEEERPKIIVEDMVSIEDARKRFTQAISIDIFSLGMEDDILERLKAVLKKYKGNIPVYLNISTKKNGSYRIVVDHDLFVNPTSEMVADMEELIGQDHIRFEKN